MKCSDIGTIKKEVTEFSKSTIKYSNEVMKNVDQTDSLKFIYERR